LHEISVEKLKILHEISVEKLKIFTFWTLISCKNEAKNRRIGLESPLEPTIWAKSVV